MKILMVTPIFYPSLGGMEKFIENLALHLIALGHDVEVAVLGMSKENRPERTIVSGIPVRNFFCCGHRTFPLCFDSLAEWNDVDVVHLHDNQFGMISLKVLREFLGKPTVSTTHGTFFHTSAFSFFKRIHVALLAKPTAKRIDRIIASSVSDKIVIEGWGAKATLIENGVDTAFFSAGNVPRVNALNFVYWGRLSNNKKIERLLMAFKEVLAQVPEVKLSIIGADTDNKKSVFRAFLAANNLERNIFFLGQLNNATLVEVIRGCNYFVSATAYEGFGMSLVEAMAAGLIPIVNDIPPFRAIINDEKCGFLIDFSNPSSAAAAIIRIASVDDKTYQLRVESALARAGEYSWDKKVREHELVYQSIIFENYRGGQ